MTDVFRALALLAAPIALAQLPSSPASNTQSPFLSIPPAVSDALQFGARLPEFEAKDINGRTWRLQDLEGKFTLVYIWGTFEARAIDRVDAHKRPHIGIGGLSNLPEVQRFYERARNTKNLQVLTFCRDYYYTHAPEYIKQRNYTFPVIADWVLIKKLFPEGDRQMGGQPGRSIVKSISGLWAVC